MEGRQAITLKMDGTTDFQVTLDSFSGADIQATDVTLFSMNSIWVTTEEVLAARRK